MVFSPRNSTSHVGLTLQSHTNIFSSQNIISRVVLGTVVIKLVFRGSFSPSRHYDQKQTCLILSQICSLVMFIVMFSDIYSSQQESSCWHQSESCKLVKTSKGGRLKKMCRFLGWGSRGESKIANDVLFTTMTEQEKGKRVDKNRCGHR